MAEYQLRPIAPEEFPGWSRAVEAAFGNHADDTEWKALQPLIQKVTDTQRAAFADRVRGAFGGRNRGGGNSSGDQNSRRGNMFGTPSPEAEALQKAIDGKAAKSELKTAIENYIAARKAKQAEPGAAPDRGRM